MLSLIEQLDFTKSGTTPGSVRQKTYRHGNKTTNRLARLHKEYPDKINLGQVDGQTCLSTISLWHAIEIYDVQPTAVYYRQVVNEIRASFINECAK